ncbi:winged helix-turn-helix domain-containing protein [Ostreiculturibacter nitratireducens]|uniref:winged helix-turn-helix domain-containing protein n=1 Tax=Ostreiculturibacter nitratireducens TaxID=3075226 RepID=UPI0031B5CDD5
MSLPVLKNRAARRLFLDRHALAEQPVGPAKGDDLLALIRRLGFVQLDSINTVERAHHMILWSRRQSYRPGALKRLLEKDRRLFEHWTHDASVIPTEFLAHWRLRFARDAETLRSRYRDWQGPEFEAKLDEVLARIAAEGPVRSGEVGEDEARGKGGWWEWHPSKTALEFLWRSGQLAVTRREGFAKVYDLAERVYPEAPALSEAETIDWACGAALDRLGFATTGEIAAFWAKVRPEEAKDWAARALKRGEIEEVAVEGADGARRRSFARPDVIGAADSAPEAPARLRILSPFDPALRDRARAERLFGFHYRIEVFVPEAQRRYGYYVFPVMEGDALIGRLDARARRAEGVLQVAGFWPEPGVRMGKLRLRRLEAELDRLARFAGCDHVAFDPGWLRP